MGRRTGSRCHGRASCAVPRATPGVEFSGEPDRSDGHGHGIFLSHGSNWHGGAWYGAWE